MIHERSPLGARSPNARCVVDGDVELPNSRAYGKSFGIDASSSPLITKLTTTTTSTGAARGGDENTPPISTRTRARSTVAATSATVVDVDVLSSRCLNAPTSTSRVATLERDWMRQTASADGQAKASHVFSTPGSVSRETWRAEVEAVRGTLGRVKALSEDKAPKMDDDVNDGEFSRNSHAEASESVVVTLEGLLESCGDCDEQEASSPAMELAASARAQSEELRARVEDLRREGEEIIEAVVEEDDGDACVSPNMDDPAVEMAIARARLGAEREMREKERALVASNERNAQLKARLAEYELALDDKQSELDASEKRVQSAVREAVRDVWAQLDNANMSAVSKEMELHAATAEASELRRVLIELEGKLKHMQSELDAVNESKVATEDPMRGLMELASSAQGALSEQLDARLAEAQEDIERLTKALSIAQEAANEKVYFETENARLESEIEDVRRELTWRKAGETELRSALERSEGEIVLRKAELAKFESDIQSKADAKDLELVQLREALENAERQLEAKSAAASNAEAELTKLRVQKFEFEHALQNVTIDGSTKTHKLEEDLAMAMINVQDLTSALEAVRYELKQAQVEKERAIMEMNNARRQTAETSNDDGYKFAELTSELENAVLDCERMRSELEASREREGDLLSQLDDAFIAAKLAEEEADLDEEEYSQDDPEDDPASPTPMKRSQSRVSSSPSRKMSVANLVATNRDLVEQLSRQSNELSRQGAQMAKMSAELRGFESVAARLVKLKEDNLDLAQKYKANLQKLSEENKARRHVESRFNEYELSIRTLEQTVGNLREELRAARERETQERANTRVSESNSNVINELRDELRSMKQELENVRREKTEMLETQPPQLEAVNDVRDDVSFADYLSHEALIAEQELENSEAYATRLNEEIAKVRAARENGSSAASKPAEAGVNASEVAETLLALSESSRERAKYYKTVAKTCYVKFQAQKVDYERQLAELKSKLDAADATTPTPRTPRMVPNRTPFSAFAKQHAFLLESV